MAEKKLEHEQKRLSGLSDEIPEHIKQQVFDLRVVGPTAELARGFNEKNREELRTFMADQLQERMEQLAMTIAEYYGFEVGRVEVVEDEGERRTEAGLILP